MKTKLLFLFLFAVGWSIILTSCGEGEDFGSAAEEVIFDPDKISLFPGDTENLTFYTTPYASDDRGITFSSSNNGVATVDAKGTVTAVAPGTAIITATAKSGVKGTCNVVVHSNRPKQMIATVQFTSETSVDFYFFGSGTMTIDWGDGTDIETHSLVSFEEIAQGAGTSRFTHIYNGASTCSIKITAINISRFSGSSASLTSLDVSDNSVLQYLDCRYCNGITNITLGDNPSLLGLSCDYNPLTSLDVTKATSLISLSCNNTLLTELDVSKTTSLTSLYCDNTLLTELDVSKATLLTILSCDNTLLTELDVSKNINLELLRCRNNLFSADALNRLFGTLNNTPSNYLIKPIYITGNPGTNNCDHSIAEKKGWTVYSNNT